MTDRKQLRRSQSLSPFGVGAVYDVLGESFVAADIRHWQKDGHPVGVPVKEPRLQQVLSAPAGFRMTPEAPGWNERDSGFGVPFVRFPRWLFCSRNSCRRLYWWSDTGDETAVPQCPNPGCGQQKLTPMRFVMVCPRGHLADVPWDDWAHSNKFTRRINKCGAPRSDLRFETLAGGSGLEFVRVVCRACGTSRTLAGINDRRALGELNIRCPGTQPWQPRREVTGCNAVPVVVQRGANNVTFAATESSIDIPPFSNHAYFSESRLTVTAHTAFLFLKSTANPSVEIIKAVAASIATDTDLERDQVVVIIERELSGSSTAGSANQTPLPDDQPVLLQQEYEAFTAADRDGDARDRFQKKSVHIDNAVALIEPGPYRQLIETLRPRLGDLVQVTKLREVRALRGFSRLSPAGGLEEDEEAPGLFELYEGGERIAPVLVSPSLGQNVGWLPAIEVFGEGVFLTIDETALSQWEALPGVRARAETIEARFRVSRLPGMEEVDFSPRLVLLHTLAHLLIRQLSFECGYPLASLRERIYSSPPTSSVPMAGFLIYTAAGDAEGTLGGLVREGAADRLMSTLLKALQLADWCSSDPLCRESTGQGLDNLNLAACHACCLLPETSCTMFNRVLDRTLITGSATDRTIGFFGDLIGLTLTALSGSKEQ